MRRVGWFAAGFLLGIFWFVSVEARRRVLAEMNLMMAVMNDPVGQAEQWTYERRN